jgi:putative glutamine amidotransferase
VRFRTLTGASAPLKERSLSSVALIAIPCDLQKVGDQKRYTVDTIPVDTMARITQAIPFLVPALGEKLDIDSLLSRVQGVFVPGGLTNVHPSHYGQSPSEKYGPFDPAPMRRRCL